MKGSRRRTTGSLARPVDCVCAGHVMSVCWCAGEGKKRRAKDC